MMELLTVFIDFNIADIFWILSGVIPILLFGGGGTSGQIGFPRYLERQHSQFLTGGASGDNDLTPTTTLYELYEEATGSGGNPFEDLAYTNPDLQLSQASSKMNDFYTEVSGMDGETDWDSYVDNAVAKVDEAGVLNDIDLDTLVSAARTNATSAISSAVSAAVDAVDDDTIIKALNNYKDRQIYTKNRAIRGFASQMAGINASNSSAFVLGLALIESQAEMDVENFHANLSIEQYQNSLPYYIQVYRDDLRLKLEAELTNKRNRDTMLLQGVEQTRVLDTNKAELYNAVANMFIEFARIKYVVDAEYIANTADIQQKEELWEWQILARTSAFMGGLGGGTYLPEGTSKAGSAIGGALSGAATGAVTGAKIGAIGGGLGAVIGAGLGLGAGLLS